MGNGTVTLSVGYYNSFFIRIWSRGAGISHGEITHVATRESLRFRDPQHLLAFILAHLVRPPDAVQDRTPIRDH